jgi:putative ATPase
MNDEKNKAPLADRIRPQILEDFLGQEEVVGAGKMLRQAIETDNLPSMIFWGPPGSGKTTLASIIAKKTKSDFIRMSAVTSGLKDLRTIIKRARENEIEGRRTILFIDEIHRWNKSQQDALLPHVEKGTVVLIGATTENPSFEVRGALLSRCRVFVLKQLDKAQIADIIERALVDKENGLGDLNIKIDEKTIEALANMSNGDARTALNVLEYASSTSPRPLLRKEGEKTLASSQGGDADTPSPYEGEGWGGVEITLNQVKEAFQKSHLMYDKDGEEHYNIISALHKSMRGSDANAALYWLARMLEAGEDPLYVARRIVRFASEDIGLANSRALEQAVAAYNACHFIGLPECNVILAQAVVYMAKCEKSNDLYTAYGAAARDVRELGNLPVPLHIRNAPTKLMKNLGYGAGYKYSPSFGYEEEQEYLPEELKGRKYLKDDKGKNVKKGN